MITRNSAPNIFTNARIKYLPDENGVYTPYEMVAFDKSLFRKPGWEECDSGKIQHYFDSVDDEIVGISNPEEYRRKSYNRARNALFDLLMSTTTFDCFVTLTLDKAIIENRGDYKTIVHRLGIWCDNRVRRRGMSYVFVPEFHKSGDIHFHGCINKDSVNTVRAFSPYTGKALNDDAGRPIYNIADYKFGFSTLIPLSGENARIATAKYFYKYITKSHGEKVGGRYYLSGGNLGRPRYEYVNVDYETMTGREYRVGEANIAVKKMRYNMI